MHSCYRSIPAPESVQVVLIRDETDRSLSIQPRTAKQSEGTVSLKADA